tara:strand:- start:81 stop:209 length:129 start_codon:yes stop_codon:yes gene_type:complete
LNKAELQAEIKRIEEKYEPIGLVTLKLKYLYGDLKQLESGND